MSKTNITAQSLMKIGFEPLRRDGKICYKKDNTIYWFENGELAGPGLTEWVLERLSQKIAAS